MRKTRAYPEDSPSRFSRVMMARTVTHTISVESDQGWVARLQILCGSFSQQYLFQLAQDGWSTIRGYPGTAQKSRCEVLTLWQVSPTDQTHGTE